MLITLPLVGNEGFYDVSSVPIQIERRTQQSRGYSLSFRLIVRLEYAHGKTFSAKWSLWSRRYLRMNSVGGGPTADSRCRFATNRRIYINVDSGPKDFRA